jgi:hypothetical protein
MIPLTLFWEIFTGFYQFFSNERIFVLMSLKLNKISQNYRSDSQIFN